MNKRIAVVFCLWLSSLAMAHAEEKYTDQWIEQRKTFLLQRFSKRKDWWNQWLSERQAFEKNTVEEVLDTAQRQLDEGLKFMDNLRSVPLEQRKERLQQQLLKDQQAAQEFKTQQEIEKNDFEKKQREEQLEHMKAEHEENSDELRQEQQETH